MNLADAIRRAALAGSAQEPEPLFGTDSPHASETSEPNVIHIPTAYDSEELDEPRVAGYMRTHEDANVPTPPSPAVASGSVVRLELFLPPEQLQSLFRSIIAGQHTVMTLREAASFLRVPLTVLEKMAESCEVPSFQVDGRWRFSRVSLEEWLALKAQDKRSS